MSNDSRTLSRLPGPYVLRRWIHLPATWWESPAASSRSADVLELNQGTLYPRCCAWSRWDGSLRVGPSVNNSAPNSTQSRGPARNSSPPRPKWARNLRHHRRFARPGGIVMRGLRVAFVPASGWSQGKSGTRHDEELNFHLQWKTARNLRRGMTAEEARSALATLRRFCPIKREISGNHAHRRSKFCGGYRFGCGCSAQSGFSI